MSKLTDGFERRVYDWTEFGDGDMVYSTPDVVALLAHARALEAMLKKHQWSGTGYYIDIEHPISVCPECAERMVDPHAPDCELARLLDA
jgi:hypothetical protein